ncbi:MAG: methyltransferase RsmF C-terminal domain-like protein, partial [Flavisolibacter sp.]
DRKSFEDVHARDNRITSIRLNPGKVGGGFRIDGSQFTIHEKVPWSRYGFYLDQRPSFTFDPFFHAGCYYVQEASSMFLEQALVQLADLSAPLKVLDLCGAPGGKSTHIQSLISDESLLVSNEVIRNRSHVLVDNIIKWGASNVIVSNNDPSVFKKLEGYFDVVIIDAPCSGSGLFRRDEEAIGEWSLNNVELCSQRQKRILADALPALKEKGLLIYSTCSYSTKEDEEIADWLVEEFDMKSMELEIKEEWNIVRTYSPEKNAKGYRFYPDKLKGEGFFLACFQQTMERSEPKFKPSTLEKISGKQKEILSPWLKPGEMEIITDHEILYAIPRSLASEYPVLRSVLNIRYAGVRLGQIMKEKLVPEHALALSTIISNDIPANEISFEDSIKYLQRHDFNFDGQGKGWQLIRYQSQNLGWVNVLSNRFNNYYPKELRILKASDTGSFEK